MTELESRVVEAWRNAANDLGIKFSSPFLVTARGRQIDCIGFVHSFGRRVGTLISVHQQPSSLAELIGSGDDEDYLVSVLGEGYATYDRQLFEDTLNDWQFFGPESERPAWYSGRYW